MVITPADDGGGFSLNVEHQLVAMMMPWRCLSFPSAHRRHLPLYGTRARTMRGIYCVVAAGQAPAVGVCVCRRAVCRGACGVHGSSYNT